MEKLDLLGNDLCLIVETHEELINCLIGYYSRMIDFQRKIGDLNKIQEYRNLLRKMGDLKLDLALNNTDIAYKKRIIADLEIQLNDAKALEKSIKNLESE